MERNPFQSILTVLLGAGAFAGSLCTAPLTYAHDVAASAVDPNLLSVGTEIDGVHYWSVTEMLEAKQLINAKRSEFCAGDLMCEEDLQYEQIETFGGIYYALDLFEHSRLTMTSINPSLGTMKLFYQDEDKMLSRMFGETVRQDITSIYLVWVDDSAIGDPYRNLSWLGNGYHYPTHLGDSPAAMAASHLIIDESEAQLGSGWFTPNIEREYDITSSDITANTKGLIYYSYVSTDGGRSLGPFNYSACISSPSYQAGMECRLMYGENGAYTFMPTTPVIPTESNPEPEAPIDDKPSEDPLPLQPQDNTIIESDTPIHSENEKVIFVTIKNSEDATSSASQANSPILAAQPNAAKASNILSLGEQQTSAEETTAQLSSTASQDSVEIPLAAFPTINEPEEQHIFPWWVIALMFFGTIFFIFSWWFLLPLFKRRNDEED